MTTITAITLTYIELLFLTPVWNGIEHMAVMAGMEGKSQPKREKKPGHTTANETH